MTRNLLRGLVVVAVALTATAATAGAAQAKTAAPNGATVSSLAGLTPDVARTVKGTGAQARQQALAQYWSPTRMKAAKSDAEMPAVKAAAAKAKTAPSTEANAGAAAASQVAATPTKIAPKAPKAEPAASTSGVTTQSYFPGYPVGSPVARTYGKVFFTSFGINYVCSATIVNTEGASEVWTAGHCVSDGQAWNYNWTFVPNYVNGAAPYGYWYAYQLWTTTAWFNNNSDFANDVGSAVLYRNNGWRITDYLGGQGITWNAGIGFYMYAFGYPQAAPFNGQNLVGDNGYTYNGGGGTIFMVNYMTGGSSGGAWLNWFDGNWGYINGHNDFKYNALPQYMYSPYYGNQVANLYNTVRYIST